MDTTVVSCCGGYQDYRLSRDNSKPLEDRKFLVEQRQIHPDPDMDSPWEDLARFKTPQDAWYFIGCLTGWEGKPDA